MMYFYVNEFEVNVNDSIFSGNEQQNAYYSLNKSFIFDIDSYIEFPR